MRFTILGGRGFVGRHLAQHLRLKGADVWVPSRNIGEIVGKHLGHVVYAIGLTGDFRARPFDTIDAHVTVLANLLQQCRFDSWLYLASTRIYAGLDVRQVAHEDSPIVLSPSADSLYDLSKLTGEAICLSQASETIRVARLSNVFGRGQSKHTFLGSILESVEIGEKIVIRETSDSVKDYVSLNDVLPTLEAIALRGNHRVYNVASGYNITHAELADRITKLTGLPVDFLENATQRRFPIIDVSRIVQEFNHSRNRLIEKLSELLPISKMYSKTGNT